MKCFVASVELALTEPVDERALSKHLVAAGVIRGQLQMTMRDDAETGLRLLHLTMSVSNLPKLPQALATFGG